METERQIPWDVPGRNGVTAFITQAKYFAVFGEDTFETRFAKQVEKLKGSSNGSLVHTDSVDKPDVAKTTQIDKRAEDDTITTPRESSSVTSSQKAVKKERLEFSPKTTNHYRPISVIEKPNKTSCLTHAEHRRFLELSRKYQDSGYGQGGRDNEEFQGLENKVLQEQSEVQNFLKKLSQRAKMDYDYMTAEASRYIKEKLEVQLKQVELYHRYYNQHCTIPVDAEGSKTGPVLQFIRPLMEMGVVPQTVLPTLHIPGKPPPQVPTGYSQVNQMFPIKHNISPEVQSWNHEDCSRDRNAEVLAVRNGCHIVVSSAVMCHLANIQTEDQKDSWEIPVSVRQYTLQDGEKQVPHLVVYLDKPLSRCQHLSTRQKNFLFHKYALRTLVTKRDRNGYMFTAPRHHGKRRNVSQMCDQTSVKETTVVDSGATGATGTEKKQSSVTNRRQGRGRKSNISDISDTLEVKEESAMSGFGDVNIDDLETFGMSPKPKFTNFDEFFKKEKSGLASSLVKSPGASKQQQTQASSTSIPSTSTSIPSTSTSIPSTSTSIPSTSTSIPSNSTSIPSTSTSIPSTSTSNPLTSTSNPSTSTSIPWTSTSNPSTSTSIPWTSTITGKSPLVDKDKSSLEKEQDLSGTPTCKGESSAEVLATETVCSEDSKPVCSEDSTPVCSEDSKPVCSEDSKPVCSEDSKPVKADKEERPVTEEKFKANENVDMEGEPVEDVKLEESCQLQKDDKQTLSLNSIGVVSQSMQLLQKTIGSLDESSSSESKTTDQPIKSQEATSSVQSKRLMSDSDSDDDDLIIDLPNTPIPTMGRSNSLGVSTRSSARKGIAKSNGVVTECPITKTPASPICDTPASPICDTPASPICDTPVSPIGDAPASPIGDTPASPIRDAPASPIGDAPASPIGDAPASPIGDAPASPICLTPESPFKSPSGSSTAGKQTMNRCVIIPLDVDTEDENIRDYSSSSHQDTDNRQTLPAPVTSPKDESSTDGDSKDCVSPGQQRRSSRIQATRDAKKVTTEIDSAVRHRTVSTSSATDVDGSAIGCRTSPRIARKLENNTSSTESPLKQPLSESPSLRRTRNSSSSSVNTSEIAMHKVGSEVKQTESGVVEVGVKRRRGRPRKTEQMSAITQSGSTENKTSHQIEARITRQRSVTSEAGQAVELDTSSTAEKAEEPVVPTKRKRGRPPKVEKAEETVKTLDGNNIPDVSKIKLERKDVAESMLTESTDTQQGGDIQKTELIAQTSRPVLKSARKPDRKVAPVKKAGSGETTDTSPLDAILNMQSEMLSKQGTSVDQTEDTAPGPDNVFLFPEEHNLTYHMWNLAGFNVLVRSNYHGYIMDTKHQGNFVHLTPKLEYQPTYGHEQVTEREVATDWMSLYLRPNCSLVRARINAFTSDVMMTEQVNSDSILPPTSKFRPDKVFSNLLHIFQGLHKSGEGDYLLSHTPGEPHCKLMKSTEGNKRGAYDLHFQYLNLVSSSVKRGSWVPIDPNLPTMQMKRTNRIPLTLQPKDFRPMQNKKQKKRKKKID